MLLLLALLSGTALVAISGYGLWRGSRDARQQAVWRTQRETRDAARALRAALRSPAILDHVPAANKFTVVDGTVEHDEVIWLFQTSNWKRPLLREELRLAHIAEFVDKDDAQAAARYDEMLADLDETSIETLPDGNRSALLLETWTPLSRAAWQAHRAGNTTRRDRLRRTMSFLLSRVRPADLGQMQVATSLASAILLEARAGDHVPARWLELLTLTPRQWAAPALRRLAEQPQWREQATLAKTEAELDRIANRRAILRTASMFVRNRAHRGSPQVLGQPSSSVLALWFPNEPGSTTAGNGAMVTTKWLDELRNHEDPELPPVPAHGRLTMAEGPPREDAEPVLDDKVWLVPAPPPPLPWFSQPATLLATAGLLLALFAASVWATLRGMARASHAMRTRTEFLTGITHELKTPIASMRLIADVLHDDRDDLPDAQQLRYLAMLTGEAARLTTLIDNVLDLGQIERGERAYDLQPDCFAQAIRETVTGYEALAQHHGLSLELHEGVTSAPTVIDRGAIAQALRNLLENARKYAGSGQRVVVSTERRGDTFVASVRDHGPGIAPAERTRLFDRFVRGSRHRDGSVPGVGLGLFLSREIARHHGGDLLCVEPSEGPGAMFELMIPHRQT